jgi:triosephosphate isomerase (TIM)
MRKQIAAANWKMNKTYEEAEKLLDNIIKAEISLQPHQLAIFSVPFPYLAIADSKLSGRKNYAVAAQNCSNKKSGAYTGEVSAEILQSLGIQYCIVGHSERREYFKETNLEIAEKINLCLEYDIEPIFCCGEPLEIREAGTQNDFVAIQLKESLFHLSAGQLGHIVIAYEPIWAIGTGKTATTAQAQEIQFYIRTVLAENYSKEAADALSILYGGSVKASNAKELFSCPDVDGGLVGGASLVATEFIQIIHSLK